MGSTAPIKLYNTLTRAKEDFVPEDDSPALDLLSLVESVVVPEGGNEASDDHADIADRISGNIRRRPEQPAQGANAPAQPQGGRQPRGAQPAQPNAPTKQPARRDSLSLDDL